MKLPAVRGPLSAELLGILRSTQPISPDGAAALHEAAERVTASAPRPSFNDDFQLSLFCLYELHYRGFEDVEDRWEWCPALISTRAVLESAFEAELRREVKVPPLPRAEADAVAAALFELTGQDDGPSVSRYIAREAGLEQIREFLMHRSLYQLKEADPHTWAIPRLSGRAKAALVEVQADEYGGGHPERMHSALFAQAMRGAGLDDTYGAYIDELPAVTLASANLMSLFGLHRRLRGAIAGHLAAFEMTSSIPNRFYARGLRRLGFGDDVALYFDEHVEADAVHEQIAGRDLAGGLAEAEPHLLHDIIFGAAAALLMDTWVGSNQLGAWQGGSSSLRKPPVAYATDLD